MANIAFRAWLEMREENCLATQKGQISAFYESLSHVKLSMDLNSQGMGIILDSP